MNAPGDARRNDAARRRVVGRREALGLLGTAASATLLAACGGGGTGAARRPSGPTAATAGGSAPGTGGDGTRLSCVLQPEVTEGPYYLDVNLVRADITEGRAGTTLELPITVVDATTCKPIKDAVVDVWHCDAGGLYSGFVAASTGGGPGAAPGPGGGGAADASRFLRGTQVTDPDGLVTFKTIYPGWYRGRAVHIHVKVHTGRSHVHTGQLFFDDGLSDKVYQAAAYTGRGRRDVRNTDDGIYSQSGGGASVLAVSARGDGYVGRLTIGVQPA